MSRPGFMLYFDWQHLLRSLPDDQRGILVLAMIDYAEKGELPQFHDPVTAMAWNALWPQLDADSRRYESVVQARREAANKRWSKEASSRSDKSDGMNRYLNW